MNRFEYVLHASKAPQSPTLIDLARNFTHAVEQTVAEGEQPSLDPAVLALGAFIAFHTHADVNSVAGYNRLIQLCEQRATLTSNEVESQ